MGGLQYYEGDFFMADNPIIQPGVGKINEAVCIDTKRIYDSCVSKDCLENLRVTFFASSQRLIDEASSVKCRSCKISAVSIDVDEVPFNKGFYSADVHFYFMLQFDCYSTPCTTPQIACGYTDFNKKCILYGSEGNVKIFTSNLSDKKTDCPEAPQYSNPTAKVQAVDPVVLSCDLVDTCDCPVPLCTVFPQSIIQGSQEGAIPLASSRAVLVTLGLFSIIQMERDVQMTIPAYDFCIPDRECSCSTQDPCTAFQSIEFPVEQFFPPERENCDCPCNPSA